MQRRLEHQSQHQHQPHEQSWSRHRHYGYHEHEHQQHHYADRYSANARKEEDAAATYSRSSNTLAIQPLLARLEQEEARAVALKSYGVAARVHAAQLHLQDLERNVAFYEEQEQEAVLSRNYDLAEESKEQVAQLMQRYHDLQAQDFWSSNFSLHVSGHRSTVQGMCTVRFRLDHDVEMGQRVFVVGSAHELGAWDVTQAVPMLHSTEQDVHQGWFLEHEVAEGTTFEFKFVVLQDAEHPDPEFQVWQSGDNRVATMPWGSSLVDIHATWEGDEQTETVWSCSPLLTAPSSA